MFAEARRRFGEAGVPVPLLLGVLPLQSARHAEFLHNEVPGHHDPGRGAGGDAGRRRTGAEVGLEMSLALLEQVERASPGPTSCRASGATSSAPSSSGGSGRASGSRPERMHRIASLAVVAAVAVLAFAAVVAPAAGRRPAIPGPRDGPGGLRRGRASSARTRSPAPSGRSTRSRRGPAPRSSSTARSSTTGSRPRRPTPMPGRSWTSGASGGRASTTAS